MAKQDTRTTKVTSNDLIDLHDHICQPPDPADTAARFRELRAKSHHVMPCAELKWCPYGSLATVFPEDDIRALIRKFSDHRVPMTCSRTKRHCPAFYLSDGALFDQDPLTTCWDLASTPACSKCKVGPRHCPRGLAWHRDVTIAREELELRTAEAKSMGEDHDVARLLLELNLDAESDDRPVSPAKLAVFFSAIRPDSTGSVA